MYADTRTDSMQAAIAETERRREKQMAFNQEHGIQPQTIRKAINDIMDYVQDEIGDTSAEDVNKELAGLAREEVLRIIGSLEDEMAAASAHMDFEQAAHLRDQIVRLRATYEGTSEADALANLKKTARKGSTYAKRKRK